LISLSEMNVPSVDINLNSLIFSPKLHTGVSVRDIILFYYLEYLL